MNRKISILGAGESGIGAALLARQKGYAVWVSDMGAISASRKEILEKFGIAYEEGMHTVAKILDSDEIIKSPGIPYKAPLVKEALEKGIPVIDELEFAYRYSKGKVIAITGTNGKTTTTLLTYHLLTKGGLNVGLAGNVGQSWAGQLVEGDRDWWVIETSSFQIDGFREFKPAIAMLTNITPDHLDRYDYQVDNYIRSKMSLFKNMDVDQAAIFYAEDELSNKGFGLRQVKAEAYPVSLKEIQTKGAYFDGSKLNIKIGGKQLEIPTEEIILKGKHNMLNSMMAVIGALLAGVDEKAIKAGLKDFQNAAHRMEPVANLYGISFVNDSKGTNVDATFYALESYNQPLIWIAGGVDKGNDYTVLYPLVRDKVKMLICLGVDNEKLKSAFSGIIPEIKETQNIAEAVRWGLDYGKEGDVVLLSPACASFDLFKNYEDRGEQFKAAVNQLKLSAV
ncbi:UDP-N-acetylmuramoyl-L-alanine--D-glutamate ligase [Cecembia calidifontis]|uniref:UDP-N-acetylmuramoylalanine--D-glutamate ligase n=1 Tax=Cecembia calidifontis TaxID=1187080 RepID=A0A4Q7P7L7_9BACT|nr:UDP-N-acetylmuramoyl-L-alanine--D-glutamate ligase [Cecembia calidifontis]RZS94682.1 UDP-N-acetylmuramoylalanine--D-glutamate ligase [Cecembia calidifontis]